MKFTFTFYQKAELPHRNKQEINSQNNFTFTFYQKAELPHRNIQEINSQNTFTFTFYQKSELPHRNKQEINSQNKIILLLARISVRNFNSKLINSLNLQDLMQNKAGAFI